MRRFQEGGALDVLGQDDEQEDSANVMDQETDEAETPAAGAITSAGGLSALDMPGAAQAFALMAKSSADARKALQEARDQIMARRYNKADALLAASAALGAPTRTGSTAESFGAMAGALRGPLAAQQAFEQQKTKDLLGIGTQLAGLDQNTARAQLALAELQAKLKNQSLNAPNNLVRGPDKADGTHTWIWQSRADSRGQEGFAPQAAQTNVSLSTEKDLYGEMGKKLADQYTDQYNTALNAPQRLEQNANLRALLKKQPYTGNFAEWKLKAGKIAKDLGFNYAGDDIKNTELLISNIGQETLNNIHASGLGSGNGFTDKDLRFLQQVVGGTATLDADTLKDLADLHERAARQSVLKWNSTFNRLDKARMKELGLTKIELPKVGAGTAATGDAAEPSAAAQAGASARAAPHGLAPAEWATDPANPPPRAPPDREAYVKAHPETRQDFIDYYGYLPQ